MNLTDLALITDKLSEQDFNFLKDSRNRYLLENTDKENQDKGKELILNMAKSSASVFNPILGNTPEYQCYRFNELLPGPSLPNLSLLRINQNGQKVRSDICEKCYDLYERYCPSDIDVRS